jgi:hypothetical protein
MKDLTSYKWQNKQQNRIDDCCFLPSSDTRSDRRKRKQMLHSFSKKIKDFFWWRTVSETDKFKICDDWVYFQHYHHMSDFNSFIVNAKKKYPGEKDLIRDEKLNYLLNGKK